MSETPSSGAASVKRREPRKRPSKSLPTDRMKFDVQLRVLQAMGRLSGTSKRPIDAPRLSAAMNGEVSHYTVLLSHGFFLDAGWVDKRGRGEFSAAEPLLVLNRRSATGADKSRSIEALRDSARRAWFWTVLEPQLAHGPAPIGEILVCLMQEAEVGDAHLPQLRSLLDWLRYVELVDVVDDRVSSIVPLAAQPSGAEQAVNDSDVQGKVPEQSAAQVAQVSPTTHRTSAAVAAPQRPDAVLSLDVSLQLSAADLGQLSPEQIQALFQAVGTVLAIRKAQQL